jgi:hypothetical protein
VVFVAGAAVGAIGVPVKAGDTDNTFDPAVPVVLVAPVPPFATFKFPDSVIAPVVAVFGKKPVEPAEKLVTPPALVPWITLPAESTARRNVCVPVGTFVIFILNVSI